MNETLTLEFDGGSRGNPGPAGIGVVVRAADGTALVTLGRFIGQATNNVAEYRALITAMQEAIKLGASAVKITGDSELIIKQMTGVYRVKSPDMRALFDEAQQIIRQFRSATFHHNLRHKNELADKLANLAMDRKADITNVDHVADTGGGSGGAGGKPLPIDQPSPEAAKVGDVWSCMRCGAIMETKRPSSLRPHQLKPPTCQCGQAMVSATARR